MRELEFRDNTYITRNKDISPVARMLPSLHFYTRLVGIVLRCSGMARKGQYTKERWAESSREVYDYLEDVGIRIRITGIENLRNLGTPCVIISNHMSMLETMLFPAMVLPSHDMTFVVKEALLTYPFFKDVLQVCDPIAVTRTNPRQDLKTVMTEGSRRLAEGVSVVVFPQSTRSHKFAPEQMSSIGVKLAKSAGAPVVPVALKTDAMRNGRYLKDLGRLDNTVPVHFAFGEPLSIDGKGNEEQARITSFIAEKIESWS